MYVMVIKIKFWLNLSLTEYLVKIKPYLKDIITDLQESDTWKIQLTTAINFISSEDAEDALNELVMHSKCNNIKFIPYDNANENVAKLFKSLLSRYQGNLETSMRGSEFIFDSVQLMYYKCHKVNFGRVGSYIDFPDGVNKKNETINLKCKDIKCFQYVLIVVLNRPFIKKYK